MIQSIYQDAILPAFEILPKQMRSPEATVMMIAIGLQESRLEYRRQIGGPARGLWQFERGGGVKGVCTHGASRYWVSELCKARGVAFDVATIYNTLEKDDILAAGCARLLLFTDPKKLPNVEDNVGAWQLYIRVWRPGKPHRHTWDAFHAQALKFVKGFQS
jgi:hypothetical protein